MEIVRRWPWVDGLLSDNTKRHRVISDAVSFCDSHRIQTCNLLIRSQMLYSVELASHALYRICDCKVTQKF